MPDTPAGDGFAEGNGESWALRGVFYLYALGFAVAGALPERAAYRAAELCGSAWARLSRRKRAVVARNLSRVTGHALGSHALDAVVVEAYRSYARYWLETFRIARAPKEFFLERFRCHGVEMLDDLRRQGKGVVMVIAHLGNWDAAGAWCAASGRPMATVAEVVRPRKLFELFCRHRAGLGMTIYPARRGVTARLVDALGEGRLVALLGDRDLEGRGINVRFFGRDATFPVGPASIALRAEAPLLVAGIYGVRLPGGRRGWEAHIARPIALPEERGPRALAELTRAVAGDIERFVARCPQEWHVFQPFWTEDRQVGA